MCPFTIRHISYFIKYFLKFKHFNFLVLENIKYRIFYIKKKISYLIETPSSSFKNRKYEMYFNIN